MTNFSDHMETLGQTIGEIRTLTGDAVNRLEHAMQTITRLTVENAALRVQNAKLQQELHERTEKHRKLRRTVRAMRDELIGEMTYTAELTEMLENG